MKSSSNIKIFLVDDDAFFLKLLEMQFLNHNQYETQTFSTGEYCIEKLNVKPDFVILDFHLDSRDVNAINGLKTLDIIKEISPETHVIMLSAQDKIEVAVDCMRHKASDYVVKSETSFFRIHKIIEAILKYQKIENQLNWYKDRL